MILKQLLGKIMTDMGFITKQQLEEALQRQKEIFKEEMLPEKVPRTRLVSESRTAAKTDKVPLLGRILTDMGFTTIEQIEEALKEQEKMAEGYKSLESERLGTVIEVASIVNSSLNLAEVLAFIMEHANKVTNSTASTLMLIDDDTGELVFSVPTGPKADRLTDIHIPPGKGIAGWVAEHERPALVPDVKKDSRFYSEVDKKTGFETKSVLCVPLKAKTKLIGVLEAINKVDGTPFTEEDSLLLSIFAYQAAMAIENARLYGELKDRLEKERQIQKKLAESEKFRALGQMASGVAHDFNNMLAVILGNAELIKMDEDKDKLLKRVEVIQQAAQDSVNTIKRLQGFTKTEEDAAKFESVRINDIVKDAIDITTPRWKDQSQEKGISIQVVEHLAVEELIMLGNASDLREMLVNLIFNSVDAMPQGGRIDIITYIEEDSICLKVSDSGIGMTEETKNRIFDPFFTTKGVTHSGLGMSMVYGTIKRHNGKIEIETEPEKGTTFIIEFPMKEKRKEEKEEDVSVTEFEKANILIIDEEAKIRELLSVILSKQGHQTDIFSSGREGIEAFKKSEYDILITNLGMPDMSGWEVVSTARQIKPDVIIGMITGWDIAEDEAEQKGVDFIINKPFQINQIIQTVADIIGSKNSST